MKVILASVLALVLAGCEQNSDYRTGKDLLASGDIKAAKAAFQKAVEANPADGKSWGKLGNLHMRSNEFPKAAEAYAKAAEAEPNEAKYYVRLAEARFRSTDFDGAMKAAQQGLANEKISEDDRAVTELKACLKRAEMARIAGPTDDETPATSATVSAIRETTGGGTRDDEPTAGSTPSVSHECEELPKGDLSTETLRQLVPDNAPGRVFIRWRTESQEDNYGFNIHRGEKPGGPYTKVNESIIPGEGSTNIPRDYCYVDTPLPRGKEFYYYIESISIQGVAETLEGTKDTRVKVKTVEEEREWLRKKALGIDTRASSPTTTALPTTTVISTKSSEVRNRAGETVSSGPATIVRPPARPVNGPANPLE